MIDVDELRNYLLSLPTAPLPSPLSTIFGGSGRFVGRNADRKTEAEPAARADQPRRSSTVDAGGRRRLR
jgi:hypothetical protein